MFNVKTVTAAAAIALVPMVGAAATVTIDTFDTVQGVISPSGPGFPDTSVVAAPEAIGGFRTITAGGGASFPFSATTIDIDGDGTASVSTADGVTGFGLFEWDGVGTDLTDGGTNDTFVLEIVSVDLGVNFDLTIDGFTSSSVANMTTGQITFDFADFGDLSSVDEISLLVSGPTAFDASFSFIGAEDLIPPSEVPLPAGGLLLGSLLLGGGFVARRKAKS